MARQRASFRRNNFSSVISSFLSNQNFSTVFVNALNGFERNNCPLKYRAYGVKRLILKVGIFGNALISADVILSDMRLYWRTALFAIHLLTKESRECKRYVSTGSAALAVFGGKIQRKSNSSKKETQVYFIARSPHLTAIQQQGLVLNSSEQQNAMLSDFNNRTDSGDSHSDLCIVSVKVMTWMLRRRLWRASYQVQPSFCPY